VVTCATSSGACGDPAFYGCTDQPGAGPTCGALDLCSVDNGWCGDATYFSCANNPGAAPLCEARDLCAVNNGGCGSPYVFACSNNPGATPTCTAIEVVYLPGSSLEGTVAGLLTSQKATVTLGNDAYLASRLIQGSQPYLFSDLPEGTYFLKLDLPGHRVPRARTVVVPAVPAPIAKPGLAKPTPPLQLDLATEALPVGAFSFHWEEDPSRSGLLETAYLNRPQVLEFLNEQVPVPDLVAADQLAHDYNIILSDEQRPWDAEHAYRLLETLKDVPQRTRPSSGPQELLPSKWVLTSLDQSGDLSVDRGSGAGATVTISEAAFVHAAPRLVSLDGVRGTFFSRRLHHAVVDYVTRGGSDLPAVERILTQRYGCTTIVPDYAALTAPTTVETGSSFQAFQPAELVLLINMFEEMPQGYHSVVGLKYLVRRANGTPHPMYPLAPAVAWALPDAFPAGSYIEFMESGFTANPDDVHRLIIHEKAHFLWGYVFSAQLKLDWAAVGGWYQDASSPSGWSTSNQLEFVSAYAHLKSPNEDMAESLAYYVLDPALLQSRSPAKYTFLRDRVMHGDRYLSTLPANLTFEVLNLHPDYTYPGKIRQVDVRVEGAPDQDKLVTVELALNTARNVFAGASAAYFRLYSPIGTYVDVWLYKVDDEGSKLRGEFTLNKYAKSGLWRPDQIVISDAVGNQRLSGVNDFGWRLSIENSLEDVTPPRYVPGTMRVQVLDDTVEEADGPHPVHRAHVTWQVQEDRGMGNDWSVHAFFTLSGARSHQAWGRVDAQGLAAVDIILTDFDLGGTYGVPSIEMIDQARNRSTAVFVGGSAGEPMTLALVETTTPDTVAPEVSLNDELAAGLHAIQVSARPTHPEAPDGETVVTITYQARDDASGLGDVVYRLLDPQGISHLEYHYHPNFYTTFFQGDPRAWRDYTINVVLPVGSPPGTWGLQELTVFDKAGNQRDYNFVETMHFVVVRGP
jgi:hypothetical protein